MKNLRKKLLICQKKKVNKQIIRKKKQDSLETIQNKQLQP